MEHGNYRHRVIRTGGRREGYAPEINVLATGADIAAERVRERVVKRGRVLDVSIDEKGYLRTDVTTSYIDRPVAWQIGRYTARTPLNVIRDDIAGRIAELRPET